MQELWQCCVNTVKTEQYRDGQSSLKYLCKARGERGRKLGLLLHFLLEYNLQVL